ncbi:hypothetical protein SAMN05192574_10123 [Mucilaginibacter gossypiicola]|uniref:Uncharacterized protein n=1 Tax=Mucilaginibacter gossypiicola TaxID=551995 RepID=A0A1H7ZFU8_9SPHI|nr:hypothetical protein SAMN05192574_10123 [Mucilaginibacter gossypiicola]
MYDIDTVFLILDFGCSISDLEFYWAFGAGEYFAIVRAKFTGVISALQQKRPRYSNPNLYIIIQLISNSNHYSPLFKLSTGFVIAALMDWKLTVINAISKAVKAASTNTHH